MTGSPTPDPYPPLVAVEWVDTTNIAEWTPLADIPGWAPTGGFVCRNVGWLVHEDDDCVILAARVALTDDRDKQVGLFERIPTGVIVDRWELTPPAPGPARRSGARR